MGKIGIIAIVVSAYRGRTALFRQLNLRKVLYHFMNCKYCASEIPEGEKFCPACGKLQPEAPAPSSSGEGTAPAEEEPASPTDEPASPAAAQAEPTPSPAENKPRSAKKSKLPLAAVIGGMAVAAAAVCAYFFLGDPSAKGQKTAAEVPTTTMVSYSTNRALKTTAGSQRQPVPLFLNDAYTLSDFTSIAQLMQQSPIYVGYQNYAELENEVVYVDTVIFSVNSASSQTSHNLYSMPYGGQPVLLDSGVQAIQASGENFVYYSKIVDGKIVQYRYANGEITNVNQELGLDHVAISTCSADSSVFGFYGANNNSDGSLSNTSGYVVNGQVHTLSSTANVYYVSKDGKTVYVTDTAKSPASALYYVSDLAAGTLEEITPYLTEFIFYDDTGSAAYIGGREIGKDEINPSCNLGYFDASTKTNHIIATDAVAIVEASAKSYAWLNENSKEMFVTELSNKISVEKPVKEGCFHYINAAGDFMAGDVEGNTFTIAQGFYSSNSYTLAQDLYYLTFQNGAFLWNNGDTVYKYTVGSMAAPQTITLDGQLSDKLSGSMQVGYFMDSSGNLIEQTENTLTKKNFDSSSITSVYDSPNAFTIIGLNQTGDSVFFLTADNSLYEKSLNNTSNPKPVASQVHSAVAVTDGLYILREYGASGGRLEYRPWGEKEFILIEEGVTSLTDVVLS